jgi:hypothetical protein
MKLLLSPVDDEVSLTKPNIGVIANISAKQDSVLTLRFLQFVYVNQRLK